MDTWDEAEQHLTKQFEFDDFESALEFVNDVGDLAEEHGHHPDIQLGWGYARITLTTHEAGEVTDTDLEMAEKIDSLYSNQKQ